VKGYISFVLVFLIIASVIAMDITIVSIGRRDGSFVSQQSAFYSALDANRRIEEAASVGSAGGISAYIAYKAAELAASGGASAVKGLAESIDTNEMEKWSDAGAVIALDMMANRNETSPDGQGFYCTWANKGEIDDAMSATVTDGTLYLPTRTMGLNLGNCASFPHTIIKSFAKITDDDAEQLKSGNLSALDIEVSLYDEENETNGFRQGWMAHLYYDGEGRIAGLSEFPPEREMKILSVESPVVKIFINQSYGWQSVLNDRYNITINETMLSEALAQ
jgi:hypothetical protein